MTATIQGLPQMRAAFKRAPEVLKAQLNNATEATVKAVKLSAQQRVPVDTGTLRDHIEGRFSRQTGFGRVGIGDGRVAIGGRGGSALRSAGARLLEARKYAHFVEFGTSRVTAQPFMLPAAESQRIHYAARLRVAGAQAERQLAVSRLA